MLGERLSVEFGMNLCLWFLEAAARASTGPGRGCSCDVTLLRNRIGRSSVAVDCTRKDEILYHRFLHQKCIMLVRCFGAEGMGVWVKFCGRGQ